MTCLSTPAADQIDFDPREGTPLHLEEYFCGDKVLRLTTDEREEFEALYYDLTADTLTRGEFRDLLEFLQLTPPK